jgi:hypothetical protein
MRRPFSPSGGNRAPHDCEVAVRLRIKVKRRLHIPTLLGLKVRLRAGKELTIPAAEGGPPVVSGLVLTKAELDEVKSLIERGAVEWICK